MLRARAPAASTTSGQRSRTTAPALGASGELEPPPGRAGPGRGCGPRSATALLDRLRCRPRRRPRPPRGSRPRSRPGGCPAPVAAARVLDAFGTADRQIAALIPAQTWGNVSGRPPDAAENPRGMGTEAVLAVGFGVALGTFLTAAVLWLHERRSRKALEDVGVRLRRSESRLQAMLRDVPRHRRRDRRRGPPHVREPRRRAHLRPARSARSSAPTRSRSSTPRTATASSASSSRRIEQPGETERIEARVPHEDGTWRTLEIGGTNLLDDPAIGGLRRHVPRHHRAQARRGRAARGAGAVPLRLRPRADRHGAHRARRALLPGQPRVRADARPRRGPARRRLDRRAHRPEGPQRRRGRRCSTRSSTASPSYRLEQRFVHADGASGLGDALRRRSSAASTGEPLYIVCQIEDVTERRAQRRADRAPGDPRPADRPPEPPALRRPAARARSPTADDDQPRRGPVPRPRPLQGRQRQPRPPGGRPAARRARRPPARARSARTTRSRASAATSSPCCAATCPTRTSRTSSPSASPHAVVEADRARRRARCS